MSSARPEGLVPPTYGLRLIEQGIEAAEGRRLFESILGERLALAGA